MRSLIERLRENRLSREVVGVSAALAHEWKADRVSSLGAEIAFWNVLAIFPALLAITATIGSLEAITGGSLAAQVQSTVLDWLDEVFGGNQAAIAPFADILQESNAGIATFGFIAALYSASKGFLAAMRALTVAYGLAETRSWLRLRLMAFGMSLGTVVVCALVLAVFVLGPLLGFGEDLDAGLFETIWSWLRVPFLVVVLIVSAATFMHFAPNRRSPWRWDLPGAVLSTLFWALAVLGFRIYVQLASSGNQIYGVIGGGITVMLFVYVMSIGLLIGGELNAVTTERYGPDSG